jgi:hypothetical protein
VKSDCQVWFGIETSNRMWEDFGRLLGSGDQQAGRAEVAADGRSRDPVSVVVFEIPGDGVGVGVQSRVAQFFADPHDEVDRLGRKGGR